MAFLAAAAALCQQCQRSGIEWELKRSISEPRLLLASYQPDPSVVLAGDERTVFARHLAAADAANDALARYPPSARSWETILSTRGDIAEQSEGFAFYRQMARLLSDAVAKTIPKDISCDSTNGVVIVREAESALFISLLNEWPRQAVDTALSQCQDFLSEHSGIPWPTSRTPGLRMAELDVSVQHGRVVASFGELLDPVWTFTSPEIPAHLL